MKARLWVYVVLILGLIVAVALLAWYAVVGRVPFPCRDETYASSLLTAAVNDIGLDPTQLKVSSYCDSAESLDSVRGWYPTTATLPDLIKHRPPTRWVFVRVRYLNGVAQVTAGEAGNGRLGLLGEEAGQPVLIVQADRGLRVEFVSTE
jgi:hypothetical protein